MIGGVLARERGVIAAQDNGRYYSRGGITSDTASVIRYHKGSNYNYWYYQYRL